MGGLKRGRNAVSDDVVSTPLVGLQMLRIGAAGTLFRVRA